MNKKVIYFIRHGEDDKSFRGGWSKHGLTEKLREMNNGYLAGMKKLNKNIQEFIITH